MCKNHSHFTANVTGVLLVGPTRLLEMQVSQPLEVQMSYGEKWTKPPGTTLYLPLSISDPLPASARRLMVVSYIPSFNTDGDEMTTMQERQTTPLDAGDSGLTRLEDLVASAHQVRRYDDDLPWE